MACIWIEQPLPEWDLEDMAMLADAFITPIAVDESVYTIHDVYDVARARAADVINVKISKCGGLTRSLKIVQAAESIGITCFQGSCGESGLGLAAGLHFARYIQKLLMGTMKAYPIETHTISNFPSAKGRKDTPMNNDERVGQENQAPEQKNSALEDILREGARQLLQTAIEQEVNTYIEMCKELKDKDGRRLVVRHGFLPERSVLTGIGPVPVKKPRVRDTREGQSFTSAILPRSVRRAPSLDNLIPTHYPKGISTGDFTDALEAIMGEHAKGLSASTIARLKRQWEQEYKGWARRDLTGTRYVYWWADGIYFNVRLEDTENKRQCFLILIGAREDGTKELVAVIDGYRESTLSWKELLSSLKERGLTEGPKLAIGDGGLGFWAALR